MSDGTLAIFFTRPRAAVFMGLALFLCLWPLLQTMARRRPELLQEEAQP
jgi:TctA family transporter